PRVDVLRARDRDADLVEDGELNLRLEDVRNFVHRITPRSGRGAASLMVGSWSFSAPEIRVWGARSVLSSFSPTVDASSEGTAAQNAMGGGAFLTRRRTEAAAAGRALPASRPRSAASRC